MRKYETTHPWLSFKLDLRRATPEFWMRLGEARSKCSHLARVPLQQDVRERLHHLYLAKGVHATTAIEGNTLTEQDVGRLVEDKRLDLPKSRQYLARENENMIGLFRRVAKDVADGKCPRISRERVCEFNKDILAGLELEEGVEPGKIRTTSVGVANYRGAPAEDCSFLLDRLCDWLAKEMAPPSEAFRLPYAFIRAVMAHLYIEWIHPFGDGNGRSGRLVEFQILLASGVPSPAAHLLSNHYNRTRVEYYRQLARSSAAGGDPYPFLEYALQGFVDGLVEQLEWIFDQQLRLAWRDYVHEALRGEAAPARRRRHVALALGEKPEGATPDELRRLTPQLASDYASVSSKTRSRDLEELKRRGLLLEEDGRLVANWGLMQRYLPLSAKQVDS